MNQILASRGVRWQLFPRGPQDLNRRFGGPLEPRNGGSVAKKALVVLMLAATALLIYGRYASQGGWFYDDWRTYSLLRAHPGFLSGMRACAGTIPAGRTLACVFQAGEYSLFGSHRTDYQYTSIALLALDASLLYAVARQCRLPRAWALLVGWAYVLFPASDSTRLWDVASGGQYAVTIVLLYLLAALAALRGGRAARVLHVLSATLALVAMATYEVAVPLVAVGGVTYFIRYRDRKALLRWAADIGLVLLFLFYRVVLSPVSSGSGFVEHRDAGQTVHRIKALLVAAWETWRTVYFPGTAGGIVLVAVAVGTAVALALSSRFRQQAGRWLLAFGFGVTIAAAGALVYLTANELYAPTVFGTFNRVNLPGSFGYVLVAVAVLGLAYDLLRAAKVPVVLGVSVVAVMIAASAVHQLSITSEHITSWETSWRDQKQALKGYRVALRRVPHTADIVGFDTPIWEQGWVPVFASSWDLRGALEYETSVDPAAAYPLLPTLSCGSSGVVEGATEVVPYEQAATPLYFVSPKRETSVRIDSKASCEQTIAKWGRPPFWGSTVTGMPFTT